MWLKNIKHQILFHNDIIESIKQERQNSNKSLYEKDGRPAYSALALSGGGSHGAFGAGFVSGLVRQTHARN